MRADSPSTEQACLNKIGSTDGSSPSRGQYTVLYLVCVGRRRLSIATAHAWPIAHCPLPGDSWWLPSRSKLTIEARNPLHPHSRGAPRLGRPETTKQTVLPSLLLDVHQAPSSHEISRPKNQLDNQAEHTSLSPRPRKCPHVLLPGSHVTLCLYYPSFEEALIANQQTGLSYAQG